MKRNSIIKGIVLSAVTSVMISGCGSVSQEINNETSKIKKDIDLSLSGRAVDGYLQYATVCLDLSKDGYCQSTEPITTTLKDGSYKLDINPEIQKRTDFAEAMLLVYGGKDADTGTDFRGKLLAPANTKIINVTPMTTLIAKAVQQELKAEKKLSKEEMKDKIEDSKQKVAKIFDLKVEDLLKDPVAHKDNNPKLIKEALKIQKAVEAMNVDGDNDALEEVYEKLAEKLEFVEENKGMEALLDITFKDDIRLNDAKNINRNIDRSFEKFEGDLDLEKIAFIVKDDLRKIKKNIPVEVIDNSDERFNTDHDWDKEFIVGGLRDIGVDNPSNDQIDKLKEKVGTGKIKANVIDEIKEDLKYSEDEVLKNIYKEIKNDEAQKQMKKDQEKAVNDGENLKFTKGMTLYELDAEYGNIEYSKIHIGKNDLISIIDYKLENGTFIEDINSYTGDKSIDYVLRNNSWIEDIFDDKNYLKYTLLENGKVTLTDLNIEVVLLKQKDISGEELWINGTKEPIIMPTGSIESYLGSIQLEDEYILYDQTNYETISEYITTQCTQGHYVNTDGTTCNADTTSGKINDYKNQMPNKWSIKDVDDIKILTEKNNWNKRDGEIYAELNGKLYHGNMEIKGFNKEMNPNYNQVAIDAIKKALISDYKIDLAVQ